jgi:hypothetical protein
MVSAHLPVRSTSGQNFWTAKHAPGESGGEESNVKTASQARLINAVLARAILRLFALAQDKSDENSWKFPHTFLVW